MVREKDRLACCTWRKARHDHIQILFARNTERFLEPDDLAPVSSICPRR